MTLRIAAVVSLALAAGCHFYISDEGDDDDDVAPDAQGPLPDARPTPDADPIAPDAGGCETVDDFLARFGGCMDFAEWQAAGMCDVPSETTNAGDTCASCHTDGTGDILLSATCDDTFAATRLPPYIEAIVQPVGNSEGCFTAFRSGKLLSDLPPGHPPFAFSTAATDAITDFFQFTFARYNDPAFDCPPPKAP